MLYMNTQILIAVLFRNNLSCCTSRGCSTVLPVAHHNRSKPIPTRDRSYSIASSLLKNQRLFDGFGIASQNGGEFQNGSFTSTIGQHKSNMIVFCNQG
jgi:hypothetical protein